MRWVVIGNERSEPKYRDDGKHNGGETHRGARGAGKASDISSSAAQTGIAYQASPSQAGAAPASAPEAIRSARRYAEIVEPLPTAVAGSNPAASQRPATKPKTARNDRATQHPPSEIRAN